MQIHGIPVNLKLNSTVLMIASFIISVLAGLILNLAGAGRGVCGARRRTGFVSAQWRVSCWRLDA